MLDLNERVQILCMGGQESCQQPKLAMPIVLHLRLKPFCCTLLDTIQDLQGAMKGTLDRSERWTLINKIRALCSGFPCQKLQALLK